jgi:hypothetical protein
MTENNENEYKVSSNMFEHGRFYREGEPDYRVFQFIVKGDRKFYHFEDGSKTEVTSQKRLVFAHPLEERTAETTNSERLETGMKEQSIVRRTLDKLRSGEISGRIEYARLGDATFLRTKLT